MTGTRLNDCTPTPNEQAKYVISDAEHEAQIRRNHSLAEFKNGWGENKTGHKDGFVYDHWKEKDDLLHLLDKARAEATVAREQLRKTCAKILGADTDWPQHDNVSFAIAVALHLRVTAIREARSEIARLRTPPEADVMELARKLRSITYRQSGGAVHDMSDEEASRALTAYGDQRAREAEAAMRDKLLDHADACVREARAAAIEEAA
jgi:hypothetical protein